MSTALPEWYTKSRYNEDGTSRALVIDYKLEVVDVDSEHVVIRFPNDKIKWDSSCLACKGEMKSEHFPSHENTNTRCGGTGHGHCTCDRCWG